jgi:MerR family redox-sensitive transcriptional activator SoxR
MKIGELACRSGFAASALRYYESLGLLPAPKRQSGRRVYGDDALDRLFFIRFAQRCGFQLDEIAELLGIDENRPAVSARLRELAVRKTREIDELIATAEGMKLFLAAALDCRCITADECGRKFRSYAQTAA